MAVTTLQRYIITIEEISQRADKIITAYDERLKERLELSERQIARILDELEDSFDAIVKLPKTRPTQYKLLKPIDLFEEAFEKYDDLGWLFELAQQKDPDIFDKLTKNAKTDHKLYLFKNTPFEDLESIESKQTFQALKTAVKNREYKNLIFKDNKQFKDVKCLKLLFMEGNWYLAYVAQEGLRLGRVNFIQKVEYAKGRDTFQASSVTKELNFLKTKLQNPFTLYGNKPQKATIKALPPIAHYFDKEMKKFLPSQKFIKKEDDTSVIFTCQYTQAKEILPLVQKWMPHLIIIEPESLREKYKKVLSEALENLS